MFGSIFSRSPWRRAVAAVTSAIPAAFTTAHRKTPFSWPLSNVRMASPLSPMEVAEIVSPALVYLVVSQQLPGGIDIALGGMGVIIDADGTILTSTRLVAQNAFLFGRRMAPRGLIMAKLQDNGIRKAHYLYADYKSGVAVLKIAPRDILLPTVELGLSSKLCQGDHIFTLDWPVASRSQITQGVVSSTDGRIVMQDKGHPEQDLKNGSVANEECFGGPIVNLYGEVVGINLWRDANSNGLSIAAPIESAIKVVEQSTKEKPLPLILESANTKATELLKSKQGHHKWGLEVSRVRAKRKKIVDLQTTPGYWSHSEYPSSSLESEYWSHSEYPSSSSESNYWSHSEYPSSSLESEYWATSKHSSSFEPKYRV